MNLDVYTIYVLLIFLTMAFTATWAMLWRTYSHVPGIPAWTLSGVLALIGQIGFAYFFTYGGAVLSIVMHAVIHLCFCLFWVGIRQFHHLSPPWLAVGAITLFSIVGMIIVGDNHIPRTAVLSLSAALPFALVVHTVLPRIGKSGAASLVAVAMTASIIGELTRLGVVITFSSEAMPSMVNRPVGVFAVVMMIFGIVTCHFGFMLGIMERVRFELSALVVVDELTGLSSRRHFLDRLAQECARAQRTRRPFCLLVVDLDGFKTINDAYGHAAGDLCLRAFGEIASARLRRTDVIGRMGGDEFSIIMPETRLSEALRAAEDLRMAVGAQTISWKGREIRLAASIGVTEWDPARAQSLEDLVGDADQALYHAKDGGRDQVAAFPLGSGAMTH